MKKRMFAMSDIHGEFEKFQEMLRKIKFSSNDTLYIIGDVVDRGEYPIEIIEWIMKSPNVILLRGNHESMFIDYLDAKTEVERYVTLQLWMKNGGYSTYIGYEKRNKDEKKKIEIFIRSLPFYKVVGNLILVHSGIDIVKTDEPLSIHEVMERQDEDVMLWSREEFFMHKALDKAIIIFGHTPTGSIQKKFQEEPSKPMKIWHDTIHQDKIGIDCGAVFEEKGGRLACLCLDTMKEYYV